MVGDWARLYSPSVSYAGSASKLSVNALACSDSTSGFRTCFPLGAAASIDMRVNGDASRIEIASSLPSFTRASGAIWNIPPKFRPFAMMSIRCAREPRATAAVVMSIAIPSNLKSWRSAAPRYSRSPVKNGMFSRSSSTAMSKPNPVTLRKYLPSMRPTSTSMSGPSTASFAVAARSRAGAPTVFAKSFPVPAASSASRQSEPDRSIALAALLHVPSPPHATTVVAPSCSASATRRFSSPGRSVSRTSVTPTAAKVLTMSGSKRKPRPLPEAGFTITVTRSVIDARRRPASAADGKSEARSSSTARGTA